MSTVTIEQEITAGEKTTTTPIPSTTAGEKTTTPIPSTTAMKPSRGFMASLGNPILLGIVAACNVPFYIAFMWTVGYLILMWNTSSFWMRTMLAIYFVFGFLDNTPQSRRTSSTMKRIHQYCRSCWTNMLTAKHFPVNLIKTCDLPAENEKYVFCYHPHGVICMGATFGLSTNGCDFDKEFPGIERSCVTLNLTFCAPIARQWIIMNGFCGPNRSTLEGRLEQGDSLVLIPGGAYEALHTVPHTVKLRIQNRKGFVRLALKTGAKLVPVFGFGENEVFDTVYAGDKKSKSGSWAKRMLWGFQKTVYDLTTMCLPIWTNLIPNRVPINVVVGAPVEFPKDASVDECHRLYVNALEKLYNEHKDKYGYGDIALEYL